MEELVVAQEKVANVVCVCCCCCCCWTLVVGGIRWEITYGMLQRGNSSNIYKRFFIVLLHSRPLIKTLLLQKSVPITFYLPSATYYYHSSGCSKLAVGLEDLFFSRYVTFYLILSFWKPRYFRPLFIHLGRKYIEFVAFKYF